MPTIRGYKKGINDEELKKIIDNYTSRVVTAAKRIGIEAMRELRESAVNTWYNSSTAKHAVNESTVYEIKSVTQNKGKIEIIFRSYVDEGEFEALKAIASERNSVTSPYTSVVKWRERHSENGWKYKGFKQPQMDDDIYSKSFPAINMPKSVGQYMFDLLWEEGIVGLPPHERVTGTKWINPKPAKERDPMKTHVEAYLKKNWGKKIRKKYREEGIVN